MRRRLHIALFAAAMPLAGLAQDEPADDGTRLERFLESQLSDGEDFNVSLVGFRGALSSSAQLDRMTIADADGVWLVLEGGQLDWNRSALLSGALDITALRADRVELLRQPTATAEPTLPSAEATPFQLPDLPVSIAIGEITVSEVHLAEPILGQAAALAVTGSANLAEGDGDLRLVLDRLDGPRGQFDLAVSFAQASRDLNIDLRLEEEAGGLSADLLNLPGRPSVAASVIGQGPLSDFTAQVAVATDGADRFGGQVISRTLAESGDHQVLVDLNGDISPLVNPSYRAFFGNSVALRGAVMQRADGRLTVDDLQIDAAALSIAGDLALQSDGHPDRFRLSVAVQDPDGGQVRLPVSGQDLRLNQATLDIGFDAENGNAVQATVDAQGVESPDGCIERVHLDLLGEIVQSAGAISSVTARLTGTTRGVDVTDAALARAVGTAHTFETDLTWTEGQPAALRDLRLRAGDMELSGDVALDADLEAAPLTLALDLEAQDIARFADLAGQPLSGRIVGGLDGTIELLSGAFDLALEGVGTDLGLAEGLPEAILAGDTQLAIAARRDETGLTLDQLDLAAAELTLSATGRLSQSDSALDATATLANIGRFTPTISGPATADVAVQRGRQGPWQVTGDLTGPVGITAQVAGDIQMPEATPDLTFEGVLPLALANRALAPRSVQGMLRFEAGLRGGFDLASVSGQFSTSGTRVALPTVETALEDVSATGSLQSGRVSADVSGRLGTGGQITAQAQVDITQASLPGQVSLTGRGLRIVDPTLYEARIDQADLSFAGPLASGGTLSGQITMGDTELRVPETGLGAADIPQITHLGETSAERQTRLAAGLGPSANGGGGGAIGLDVTVTAPGRVYLRGRGLDAELGGQLRLTGTSANVIPVGRFDLIRGRLSILGTRLDLSEGSATLQGNSDPFVRLLADSRAGQYRITISVIGPISNPDITFASDPALPEDEVLAQLLFGRSVSALSPVQLLQLADAAAALAGGSSQSGLFARLRENTGLDDLDLQTDEAGNAAIRAGRYLSDNVYTDVTVGTGGETDLSLNIDLTDDITARGSFSSDGESSLGVFFERDY